MNSKISQDWVAHTVKELPAVAEAIKEFLSDAPPVWRIEGVMGAGKTTFSSAMGKVFGVEDMVQSPTFGIVNEYYAGNGKPIYHFDFYRVKDEREAREIGIEEYLDSGELCWLEWAEKIENLLPDAFSTIEILIQPDNSRKITASYNE
jgi:tRNA threonylcarbamoyladenosine biosynthesis protein TsaE